MKPARWWLLALLALAVVPLAAQARLNVGAGFGLGVQSDTRFKSSIFGPALQGFLTRRLSSRLSIRSELLVSYFRASTPPQFVEEPVGAPCPPNGPCPVYAPAPRQPLGIGSLTLGAVLDDTGDAHIRSYLIVGSGLFGAYQHPAGDHRLFPGVDVGLGSRLGRSTRFEMRYHWVPGWKGGGLSLGWMGLGTTF